MMVQTVPSYQNFVTVIKQMGRPKALFYWTIGDPSTDQAVLFVWAFLVDDVYVFNTSVPNNPVGTIDATIAMIATDFPLGVPLATGTGLGAYSV